MLKKIASVFLMAFLLLPIASMAKKKIASPAKSGDVLNARLGNGMQVIIIRDTLAPVVATMMNYKVGSDQSPKGFPGTAHAQEHMMFRGSKTLSADQYAEITAITGGKFDADTMNSVTQYFYIMPSQDLDIALQLERNRATGILDSVRQWGQERGAIEQEVTGDYSDAEFRLFIKMQKHLMRGTPDADFGLGTVPTFDKTTAQMLKKFYDTYYHPNRAVFIIVGDVDPKSTLTKVEKIFGSIPAANTPSTHYGKNPRATPASYHEESDLPFTAVITGYPYPSYHDKDWAASEVLSDVLSSQRGPLYELVANGKALSVSFFPFFLPEHGTSYAEIDVPVGSKPEIALQELEAAIDSYEKNGVPADLVEAAKKREAASAQFDRNSIFGLANTWSQAVAIEGRTSPDEDVSAIKKVTVADVNRVLRQYLVNKSATVGYAIPKPGGHAAPGGGRGPENNTVIPGGPVVLPSWAKKILSHLSVPEKTLNPVVMHLPNGITLVVQRKKETPTVVLHGEILSNPRMETPRGKMGVSSATEGLLPFGTTTYSRLQYQVELDKISATVSTGADFSLSVLSRYFDRGVQLLADDELHPSFPEKAFDVVKSEEEGTVKGEQTSPDHLAEVALAKALYPPDDPQQRFPTPESVAGLTLGDVKTYYGSVYRPDMTTIVMVGDVSPERARSVVEKYFGDWKASGPKPEVYPKPAPDNHAAYQVIPATGRIQDAVTLSQTMTMTRTDDDFAPLAMADAILGKGFYASLLYHDVREVKGYVYYVESDLAAGKTRSTFSVTFGAMPDKTQLAKGLIVSDLKRLQKETVSAERLEHAKALMLGEVPLREQSYNGVATQFLNYAVEGLPLDQNLRDAKNELSVSRESVMKAVAKWIRPDDLVEIVQGPAPAAGK